jgi:hypothetical protein
VGVLIVAGMSSCSLVVDLTGLTSDASSDATNDVAADVAAFDVADVATSDGGCVFFDDFNRSTDGGIGNAWIAKQTGFVLVNGTVQRSYANTFDYPDLIVRRPSSEDAVDVTASMEVTYGIDAGGFPQLHARIQEATVNLPDAIDSYLLFPSNGGTTNMTIARATGTSGYYGLATFPLGTPLELGSTYRFTLSVQGTTPVALSASVERFDGNIWTTIGAVTANDAASSRIAAAGSVGFSASNADLTSQFAYDNFCRR